MRSQHVVVLLILVVFTFLAIPCQSGADVINACKNDRSGTLRVVDDVTECRNSESPLSWNTEGPQGNTGPQGEPGTPGGFDVSKLYVVTCEDTDTCSCDDTGGIFISGSAACPLTDNSIETSLYVANYNTGDEEFHAVCTAGNHIEPLSSFLPARFINLICYDNSEE